MVPALIITGVCVLVGLIIAVAIHAERKNKRELTAAIQAFGFHVGLKPDQAAKAAAFVEIGALQRLKTGAKGLTWIARGELSGLPILLVEHRYVVSTGKHTSVHYHTIAATPAPSSWPKLTVSPENVFHRIAEFFGSRDLKMEDDEFNRRWRVKGDDENFAVLALSPGAQAWFKKMPAGPWIEIGSGAVCVVSNSKGTNESATRVVRLLAEFVAMLPTELEAYGVTSPCSPTMQKQNSPGTDQGW